MIVEGLFPTMVIASSEVPKKRVVRARVVLGSFFSSLRSSHVWTYAPIFRRSLERTTVRAVPRKNFQFPVVINFVTNKSESLFDTVLLEITDITLVNWLGTPLFFTLQYTVYIYFIYNIIINVYVLQ